jgi:hypothetical protein
MSDNAKTTPSSKDIPSSKPYSAADLFHQGVFRAGLRILELPVATREALYEKAEKIFSPELTLAEQLSSLCEEIKKSELVREL